MSVNLQKSRQSYNEEAYCLWLGINQSSSAIAKTKILAVPQALFCVLIKAIYHFACALFCGIGHLLSGDFASFRKNMTVVLLDFKEAIAHFKCLFNYQQGQIDIQRIDLHRANLCENKCYENLTFLDLKNAEPDERKKIISSLQLDFMFKATDLDPEAFFGKLLAIHPQILTQFRLISFTEENFAKCAFINFFINSDYTDTLEDFYQTGVEYFEKYGEEIKKNLHDPNMRIKYQLLNVLKKVLKEYPEFFEILEDIDRASPAAQFQMGELFIVDLKESRLPMILASKEERLAIYQTPWKFNALNKFQQQTLIDLMLHGKQAKTRKRVHIATINRTIKSLARRTPATPTPTPKATTEHT